MVMNDGEVYRYCATNGYLKYNVKCFNLNGDMLNELY